MVEKKNVSMTLVRKCKMNHSLHKTLNLIECPLFRILKYNWIIHLLKTFVRMPMKIEI